MCNCNKTSSKVVESGIVHYSFTDEDLRPARLPDGLNVFLRILRREEPDKLFIRIVLADVVDGELRGLIQNDVLADKDYLEQGANGILAFEVRDLNIQEPTPKDPLFKVSAVIDIPERGKFPVENSVSFEGLLAAEPGAAGCFYVQRMCMADCCWDQYSGRCLPCFWRCRSRVCSCTTGGCGPWIDEGFCTPWCY